MKHVSRQESVNSKMTQERNGQVATEFILLLPYLCALILIFIMFILYCVRSQTAMYTGFMAARVYNVQETEEKVMQQINGLIPNSHPELQTTESELMLSTKMPLFQISKFAAWNFTTTNPFVLEPKTACAYEDNPLMDAELEECQ